MEIKKENLVKSKIKLTVKVSSPEMRGFFSRVYDKLAPNVEVKGFRPGMAPKALTISAIGESRISSEIIDVALQETFVEALKKEDLMPITQPKVNVTMMKDLTVDTAELEYEAEFEVLPKVEVGDYKKIKVKAQKEKSKDEDGHDEIDHVLSHLQRERATFKDIDRPLKDGDRAEINFEGSERGVKLENLTSQNYPVVLGSKVLLPEFEKNLVGLKKGDKKEFKNEIELPGTDGKKEKKKVDFKVEILQTQEVILPELNDEFAKTFQQKTMADLKKAITEDVSKQKAEVAKRDEENAVLEELVKITKTDVPEGLLSQELDRQIEDMKQRMVSMGMTFEQYLASQKKSEEEFRVLLKPQAERTIKIGLALGEIVKREGIDQKDKQAGKIALEKLMDYSKSK